MRLVYSLRKPTVDGRSELILTPLELLDRVAHLVTPPRIHKHRYCGVPAPNAKLRRAVTESAGPAGATLQLLREARQKMGMPETEAAVAPTGSANVAGPRTGIRRAAARCWALLLVRIYDCLPLVCPRCGEPQRIIAFVLEPPVIERILDHIGEPTAPPEVLPARGPPQAELGFDQVDQKVGQNAWPEMDQTAGRDTGGFMSRTFWTVRTASVLA
ncbi:MAG: transposase [bacterium]